VGNKGMTMIELIVVLSIFAVMSSVVMFNYKNFQTRIDIRNLSNDIALKLVEAQKSATSGKWNSSAGTSWKPAYGVYFNKTANNKNFIYFADLNNDNMYAGPSCGLPDCLDTVTINKGNYISNLDVVYQSSTTSVNDLTVAFTRPNYGPSFSVGGSPLSSVSYIQITISSIGGATSLIKLYASGRIQIN
jgi:prepilin-type N-terminal cleavage/methylation domain-containing protein